MQCHKFCRKLRYCLSQRAAVNVLILIFSLSSVRAPKGCDQLILPHKTEAKNLMDWHIQGVSGGTVNILGGGSMDYSE